MAYEGFTKLRNGLYMDNKTRKIGYLTPAPNGGWYIEDISNISGLVKRGDVQKALKTIKYQDVDDMVKSFYKRKNKFGELKKNVKLEDVERAKGIANEKLAEAMEFGNLYESPIGALPGEYDINEFSKIDETAKTRNERFAERNQIAENLQKYAEDEYESDRLFIPDRNVIEDENGNTFVTNDEYARQLNTTDMKTMGKRIFSPEEKVAGYQKRKGITQAVDDKAIERDIKSLFIYQNEPTMGTLEKEPLKRYYDEYGKENVDRVWKSLDDKYAVIEGTTMDNEGLRYNELVEKNKYSPEAIDFYKKQVENAWKEHSWDEHKYNEATAKAKEEFERFDSERSSWEKEDTKPDYAYESRVYGVDVEEADRELKRLYPGMKYSDEVKEDTTEKTSQNQQFADAIRQGKMDKNNEDTWINPTYSVGEYGNGLYVQFQDIENHKHEDIMKYPNVSPKVESLTWARVWNGKDMVFEANDSKYGARKQVIDYLEGRGKSDTSPMSEWSDTTGTGYSDAQTKAIKELEGKYPINKSKDGTEYMRTSAPYDDTEYAYASKNKDGSWTVKDPTKSTDGQPYQNHIYNTAEEAREKMEEVNNRIRSDYTDRGKSYEGVSYNRYQKSYVTLKTIDHRYEKPEAQVERFKERKGPATKDLGINITEAPKRATRNDRLPYLSETSKGPWTRDIDMGMDRRDFSSPKDQEILGSVVGQLSDGIWENSPGMQKYWSNMDFGYNEDGRIIMRTGAGNSYTNPFVGKSDKQVRDYVANKVKQIVKTEMDDGGTRGEWDRNNTSKTEYLGYKEPITVADAYSVYDRLKGRKGKKYNTFGKTSFTKNEVEDIKAQVERYKKRKNK